MCFDNLGGNQAYGLAQSFNARFFCRMCLCSSDETKKLCHALPEKYRTKANYEEAIHIIQNSSKVDLKVTKGVSEYCVLNDIESFHILENWTGDIMHDLCEGAIGILLKKFFERCISNKVLTENQIKNLISSYDFGVLNRRFVPSGIQLERKNLNQNASQMKCLMLHIPFIFHKYKNVAILEQPWICINSMLKIVRICYSNKIHERDLTELDLSIQRHHENMKSCFKIDLWPKHHLMTHYSEITRRSGPLCYMSTLRFEMKHKELTDLMKNTTNFQNVTKTIAQKYQKKNVFRDVFVDKVQHTQLKKIDQNFWQKYEKLLVELNCDASSINWVKNLQINSDFYEDGLILKHQSNYLQIEQVLCADNTFFFICSKYNRINFDEFLMSVEIKPSVLEENILIAHSDLDYSKTHEKKMIGNQIYILSDSLEVQ